MQCFHGGAKSIRGARCNVFGTVQRTQGGMRCNTMCLHSGARPWSLGCAAQCRHSGLLWATLLHSGACTRGLGYAVQCILHYSAFVGSAVCNVTFSQWCKRKVSVVGRAMCFAQQCTHGELGHTVHCVQRGLGCAVQ